MDWARLGSFNVIESSVGNKIIYEWFHRVSHVYIDLNISILVEWSVINYFGDKTSAIGR